MLSNEDIQIYRDRLDRLIKQQMETQALLEETKARKPATADAAASQKLHVQKRSEMVKAFQIKIDDVKAILDADRIAKTPPKKEDKPAETVK